MFKLFCRVFQKTMKLSACFLPWKEPTLLRSIDELVQHIADSGLQHVLVVTDEMLMKLGLPKAMLEGLQTAGVTAHVYDKTCPNPTIENIEAARAMYVEHGCRAIVAFGGGSPMDCAKLVGARIGKPRKPVTKLRGLFKVLKKLPPLYAVPTTAGTGSEVTIAAVATNPATQEKFACMDPSILPNFAVLDPALTLGLPPHMTSTTGMDALTHAVEAYIGGSNTKKTASNAVQATKLVFANLETAYQDGSNIEARKAMLEASYMAGVAFTRAYVGNIHAISHALGALYHVPHGLANAVVMPHVLQFYGEKAHKRLGELAQAVGLNNAEEFVATIRGMNERMQIPAGFACIKADDLPAIAARATKEANPLYPVPVIMNREDVMAVVRGMME
jgi:alcohol dehydrogenase class IV